MKGFVKRNINGILGTVLFHMIIIVVAMAFKINTPESKEESYMIIDPEFLEEVTQEKEQLEKEIANLDDIEIEKYLNEIRNVGSSSSKTNYQEIESMSQEELRKMYEAEMLKEKYGDEYEAKMNSTYEDYLKENPKNNTSNDKPNNQTSTSNSGSNYAGPALVYVELDNKNRGQLDVKVPVFTCKGGGKVVISISIGSDGTVKSASVLSSNATGDDACLDEAAKSAALRSRFTSIAGGKTEGGKITYTFIQQ
jgi:TonB family protein